METEITTNTAGQYAPLPSMLQNWRQPRRRNVTPRLGLELYELEYLPLTEAPRESVAHEYKAFGKWNRAGLLERYRESLVRSKQRPEPEPGVDSYRHESLVFRLPAGELVLLVDSGLEVYAPTFERAWELGESLREEFRIREAAEPLFHILSAVRGGGVESREVKLPPNSLMAEQMLKLCYGEGIGAWQSKLVAGMRERHCGISIVQGPPGTGKTTFLRHLIGAEYESFRFYFVPSANLDVLKDKEFVTFWAGERAQNPAQGIVVMLEDAEAILATRAGDNREAISNLLNITDGFMGDFLRMHLICTMNADLDDLDPAILRPGRLLARRHFGRIPRSRALELMQYLEKPAPAEAQEDYSLAELMSTQVDDPATEVPRRQRVLGFGVA